MACMNELSNPEKVAQLLRSDRASALCDDCIAEIAGIKNRIAVNPITSSLGLTSDFERAKLPCSRCDKTKLTTKAVR